MTDTPPRFLTTREVADLLRVKERKVYDLAAAGDIPHRRVTGKLLFSASEIDAWLSAPAPRPDVLTGSHDPLLDWAVRESGAELALLINGSGAGLDTFAAGRASAAGLHLPSGTDWNIPAVAARAPRNAVLIDWAKRVRGLLLPPGSLATTLNELKGKRLALRPEGTGSAALLADMMRVEGLSQQDFAPGPLCHTEHDAAAAVAEGRADAALGLQSLAATFGLGFAPLIAEQFDLLIDRTSYFQPPLQTLLRFALTHAFRTRAEELGGYGVRNTGRVRWLSES